MEKLLNSPASFRPISITSYISKLFENIFLWCLLFFSQSSSILSPRRASFRLGWSTLGQILFFSQSILDEFNKPNPNSRTILTTIDLSEAFNSVWHSTLFHKLISASLPLTLLVGFNLFSYRHACAIFKITKVVPFESVEVFCKDLFLAVYFSFFSSIIFLLLCLLPLVVLFMLTTGYLILHLGVASRMFQKVTNTMSKVTN